MTYMNLSGKSILAAVRDFDLVTPDCLLVVDDVALPFGALRLRARGSAGGHNGIASVLGALQTLEVPRLRCGVGHPLETRGLADYVTDDFDTQERAHLDSFIEKAADAVLLWLRLGIDRAMNRVNAG
jgi:PTH1 family peptidyl-tRNA hydrolase